MFVSALFDPLSILVIVIIVVMTLLGMLWFLLTPIFLLLVYGFVLTAIDPRPAPP